MNKDNYYEEFNASEDTNTSIDFISKSRRFYEKHIGLRLSRISYFFKKTGKRIKEKFTEKFAEEVETPIVREPRIEANSVVNRETNIVNLNEELYKKNVGLIREINFLISSRKKEMDLSSKLDELKKITKELSKVDKNNDYKGLEDINSKLLKLQIETVKEIGKFTSSKEEKESKENTNPFYMKNDETKKESNNSVANPFVITNEEIKKEESSKVVNPFVVTKEEDKKTIINTNSDDKISDLSRVELKINLMQKQIDALEKKIESKKLSINEQVRYVEKVDLIINNANLFAKELKKPVNKRSKAVKEMGNEFNLDSREIRLYEELKAERMAEIDKNEDELELLQKELKENKAKLENTKNEMVTVKMPNRYAKEGFINQRMTYNEYLEETNRNKLIDNQIELIDSVKESNDLIAKLEEALASAKENKAKIEELLNQNSDKLGEVKTITNSDQIIIRSFHK